MIWVWSGVIAAGVLGWAAVVSFPEDRTILRTEPYDQINYDILSDDAELANLERGRSYYVQLCALCHGANGNGFGEFSYRMVPKPADLAREETINQTDAELDAVIRDGIQGTAMAAWGDTLSSVQRQQVIGYIRYLALQRAHLDNG